MLISANLIILLAGQLCLSCCVSTREIIISENGSSCIKKLNPPSVPCRSLVAVSDHVTRQRLNNTVIRIKGAHSTLQGLANFSGVNNITITGEQTFITCNASGAGIAFNNSSNIIIETFTIAHCGALILATGNQTHGNLTGNTTAIQFIDCAGVDVLRVVVTLSIGQGFTFVNTRSTVQVIDSLFINNSINIRHCGKFYCGGGGGLQIVFFGPELPGVSTSYTVAHCEFKYNRATVDIKDMQKVTMSVLCERGGGIRIILFDNACKDIDITLQNNVLIGNSAAFGGGAALYVSGKSSNNCMYFLNNRFIANKATAGGGGLSVGYTYQHRHQYPMYNFIDIRNSSFVQNDASFGGGMSIFFGSIGYTYRHPKNRLKCEECYFQSNTARGGAAVNVCPDVSKQYGKQKIIRVNFINSTFDNNLVIFDTNNGGAAEGNGAFFTSNVDMGFHGSVNFTGNNGTALYLDSSTILFWNNISVRFSNNSGYQGGAILLFGTSKIYFGHRGYFYFYNNSATTFGGALCDITTGEHIDAYLKTCFLRVYTSKVTENLYIHFSNNSAEIGKDIYVTSIASCDLSCEQIIGHPFSNNQAHFFDTTCHGNYTFEDTKDDNIRHVATSPINVTIGRRSSSIVAVFPGIPTLLDIVQYDEMGDDVSKWFPLTAKILNQNVKVDSSYVVITNNTIVILGRTGVSGQLMLENQAIRHIIKFKLHPCPPGFVWTDKGKCVCFTNNNGSVDYSHIPIKCEPNGAATITINYWAGYDNDSQNELLTGICVAQLCDRYHGIHSKNCTYDLYCRLPFSKSGLQKAICGKNREGVLCGKCDKNLSFYYDSNAFICGHSNNCQYGILFYIAAELLPVTLIFLIILLLNINLTSGALYSFVFYAQILTRLSIEAYGTILIKDAITKNLLYFFEIILGIFNFQIVHGGYCVFHTNSIMNLFMIRYATMAYAFFLVLVTILVLRLNSCYSCVKLCRRCGRKNIRGSIVDGLSAFLVLCYFECAVVTAQILTPSGLHNLRMQHIKTVAMYDGQLDYLSGNHLWYAVPAFLCLVFILIPPPTILLLEPLLTKLFNMNHFTCSPSKWLYNRLRLKLMPFLDSFQACFKDRHRYFAGFYFLYRLLIPLIGTLTQGPQQYYATAAYIFFLILLFHTLIQPYKKKWHSLLDLYLLISLIFLFMTTVYNAYRKNKDSKLIRIQLVVMFSSIVYIVIYTAYVIQLKLPPFKVCKKGRRSAGREITEATDNTDSLPYRLLHHGNDDKADSYKTF